MTTKLPVVGTSAATTAFCATKLEGPGGHLWLDGNGKITAGNGTLAEPKPNALSLLPGNTEERRSECPGSTAICRASCYVHGLEKHAGDTFALYEHNTRTLRGITDPDPSTPRDWARFYDWAAGLANWATEHARGGFRWHVSGDVYSDAHAYWIMHVAMWSPSVTHWIYTRTFEHAWRLADLENLSLNLSADDENYARALAFQRSHPRSRICYLSHDGKVPANLPEGSVVFPDYAYRATVGTTPAAKRDHSPFYQALTSSQRRGLCPVDFYGKSEQNRCGPCSKCIDAPVPVRR
jgi:hypothetical protein